MLLSGGMYYFVPGEGGEGRRGEAHHDVGQRHVAHEQVHARVQTRAPANTHLVLLELQAMHQLHRRRPTAFSWLKGPTTESLSRIINLCLLHI